MANLFDKGFVTTTNEEETTNEEKMTRKTHK